MLNLLQRIFSGTQQRGVSFITQHLRLRLKYEVYKKINNKYLLNSVSITRIFIVLLPFALMGLIHDAVSYTHLDVYKRQVYISS